MNIKSLLLGSAAALAVVSGAHAADAIVAAEPEPAEYVKVCDAFGTGYFYIPGSETCLKIGGFARYQVNLTYDSKADDYGWNTKAVGYFSLDAKSSSELGDVEGFIGVEGDIYGGGATNDFYMDEAWLSVGGFKAGWFYSWLDAGLAGETDSIGGSKTEFVSASYTFKGEGVSAGVAIDELVDGDTIGLQGMLSASVGGVTADLVGYYDTDASEGGVRAILGAEVGPGTFQLGALYNSGVNTYNTTKEWAVAAAYAIKATDTLTVTPGVQYTENLDGSDAWNAGVTVDYTLTEGLTTKTSVQYDNGTDAVTGFFRIQRSF